MFGMRNPLNTIRGFGRERLSFLAVITGGHSIIHWYMGIFSVILPSIKAGLGLSNVQVGELMTARELTQGTLNLPLGMLADALVHYRPFLLAAAPVLMGMAYMLLGIAPAFGWALLAAGLVGFGTALWHPAAVASLSNQFPDHRATAIAVHGMGATVSTTVTPLGVGALLVIFHWRGVLEFQIVPALLVAILFWRNLIGLFPDTVSRPAGPAQIREMGELARNPVFIGITLIRALTRMGRLVIQTFLPVYLQEHLGYSPFVLGFYLTLLSGVGIITQPIMAILSDRFGRKRVLFPSFIALGLLYLMLRVAAPGIQLGLVIAAIGIFFHTLSNITTAALMDVAGSKIQASSFGLASLLNQVLALPTPIAAGFVIRSYGIGSAFLMSGGFLLLAGLVVLPLRLYPGTKIQG